MNLGKIPKLNEEVVASRQVALPHSIQHSNVIVWYLIDQFSCILDSTYWIIGVSI